ncbi:MAG: aldolase [Clostridia bacterium]|nr:aldolase [Clostridia bacterium]
MALQLMFVTNRVDVAVAAQSAGVDRIFVDMEYIGKSDRQGGMDTVQNMHTLDDVRALRKVLTSSTLHVRCNPVHDATESYPSTEEEIDSIISAGADVIMLPFFQNAEQVRRFIKAVGGRVKTNLLVETPEAAENIDEILEVEGIDEIHIGLNDLHLGYGMTFMFELVADGTVEKLCNKIKKKNISYGFGGVARVGTGTLPAECILGEHYRLGSERVILSRAFCDVAKETDFEVVKEKFNTGVCDIRNFEKELLKTWNEDTYKANQQKTKECVSKIVEIIKNK